MDDFFLIAQATYSRVFKIFAYFLISEGYKEMMLIFFIITKIDCT